MVQFEPFVHLPLVQVEPLVQEFALHAAFEVQPLLRQFCFAADVLQPAEFEAAAVLPKVQPVVLAVDFTVPQEPDVVAPAVPFDALFPPVQMMPAFADEDAVVTFAFAAALFSTACTAEFADDAGDVAAAVFTAFAGAVDAVDVRPQDAA